MLSPIGPCTIWEGHCGAWHFPPRLTVASGAMGTGADGRRIAQVGEVKELVLGDSD